ncbi:MAG: IclR family transcriptional regulator [Alphaproteobacteria bacterium]
MTRPVKQNRMRGLERAFDMLDYLQRARTPQRPNEIAVGMDAPKSSIYELVGLLLERGILEAADDEGRVFLGRKLHFLGSAYLARFSLTRIAKRYLERLTRETGETSQLCMLDGDKNTAVLMQEGRGQFRISAAVGERFPLPWTASGRLLTEGLSDAEIGALIPRKDLHLPDGSVMALDAFVDEARAAQAAGYFDFVGADSFIRCLAASIHDEHRRCIATLCLVVPKDDVASHLPRYRDMLKARAAELCAELCNR